MQDPTNPTNPTSPNRHDRLVDPRLEVRPDRHLIRANGRSERYLLVEVVAPTIVTDTARRRPPVNLSFVLDRSGSMSSNGKLPLAKQATLEAHRPAGRRGPLRRRDLRRSRRGRLARERRLAGRPPARQPRARDHRAPRQHQPPRGLADRLRAGRRGPRGAGGQPRPAPDRRPRQRGHHGPRGAGPAGLRPPAARGDDEHVRRRRGLRRGAPPGDGRQRRRALLLRLGREPDAGPHHVGGGGDPRGRRPRGRPGAGPARERPGRLALAVPGGAARAAGRGSCSATWSAARS